MDAPPYLEENRRFGEIEEIEDDVERRFKLFKNFDVLSNPPYDHHFLIMQKNSTKPIMLGSALSQKIEQEWSLLEKNLPRNYSILVRAYEERIDLMRAVIVGPANTPYSHGLFFFDVCFPRNYPSCPPKLHYHSYGFDLNPNLNPGGKVSLGLSGTTWYGSFMHDWYGGCNQDQYKWNPKQSSLLDVFHAIQGVILNTKPNYINESLSLDVSYGSESIRFSKKAFVMTCRGMIHMLRAPLMDFEDFVVGYFRYRAHPILLNYRKCMDDSDEMLSLFLELYKAFERNGTYCKHHLGGLLNLRKAMITQEKRRNNGYLMKIVSKLKNLTGLLN